MNSEAQSIKILFVSKHAAHDQMAMAGNQMFNDTLQSFADDSRFDCGFLTVQKQGDDIQKMRDQFASKTRDFTQILPKVWTLFTYIFYNSFVGVLFGFIHPKWYLLDPVYHYYFKKALRKVKSSGWIPDVVVLEWTEVLFLQKDGAKLFPKARFVATEHDVTFIKLQRRFADKQFIIKHLVTLFKKMELQILTKLDFIRVLSKDDRTRLVDAGIPPDKIRVVAPFFQNKNLSSITPLEPQIVFYGAMNRVENQEAVSWFIEQVYQPFQLEQWVRFVVIGGGKNALKEKYSHQSGVDFKGFVQHPEEIFVRSLAMVVPLLNGGGIKIKVLESMSCSLPVLTNEIGMEGIGGEDGQQYLECVAPESYAVQIKKLLQNPMLRNRLGENAREWIQQHFDYQRDLASYQDEICKIADTKNRSL